MQPGTVDRVGHRDRLATAHPPAQTEEIAAKKRQLAAAPTERDELRSKLETTRKTLRTATAELTRATTDHARRAALVDFLNHYNPDRPMPGSATRRRPAESRYATTASPTPASSTQCCQCSDLNSWGSRSLPWNQRPETPQLGGGGHQGRTWDCHHVVTPCKCI